MDNVYSPPQAELEQAGARTSGRRLPPGWGPIEVLQTAWELMQRDLGIWLVSALISFFISMAFGMINQVVSGVVLAIVGSSGVDQTVAAAMSTGVVVGLTLLSYVVQIYLYVGQARMSLASVRGSKVELGVMFSGYDVVLSALGATVLLGLGWLVGTLLLVIPGVIFMNGVLLYIFALVDKDLGAVECLQESWRLTDGYKGTIFVTFLVFGLLLGIAAICTCGLGLLVITPLYALSLGLVYETLAHPEEATA